MKLLLIPLLLIAMQGCGNNIKKVLESSDCDYIIPVGYKLLCHDKRQIYLVQVGDTLYYSKVNSTPFWLRSFNYSEDYFNHLSNYIFYNTFDKALQFTDSCQAKGYIKQMLYEAEQHRIEDSIYRVNAESIRISDSIKKSEETIEHFKTCK